MWYQGGEARRERKFNSVGTRLSIVDRLLCRLEFETEGSLASRVPFTDLKIMVASSVTSDVYARLIHQPCFYYRLYNNQHSTMPRIILVNIGSRQCDIVDCRLMKKCFNYSCKKYSIYLYTVYEIYTYNYPYNNLE